MFEVEIILAESDAKKREPLLTIAIVLSPLSALVVKGLEGEGREVDMVSETVVSVAA